MLTYAKNVYCICNEKKNQHEEGKREHLVFLAYLECFRWGSVCGWRVYSFRSKWAFDIVWISGQMNAFHLQCTLDTRHKDSHVKEHMGSLHDVCVFNVNLWTWMVTTKSHSKEIKDAVIPFKAFTCCLLTLTMRILRWIFNDRFESYLLINWSLKIH